MANVGRHMNDSNLGADSKLENDSKLEADSKPDVEKTLKDLYYNVKHPAGYSNEAMLYRYVKDKGISRGDIKKFLRNQRTYTLHRQKRRPVLRNRIVVKGIDEQWELDLADLPELAKDNDGYRYLFCAIDVFSKYAWVIPLKRKNDDALIEGFKTLFAMTERRPEKIRVDKGGEFVNKKVKAYLKEKDIHFFTSQNETKCAIVERFQRTLKGYMWRYFTKNDTHRFLEVLADMVESYNRRYHRSIKRAPREVRKENEDEVREALYPPRKKYTKKKFRVGDDVRISKNKGLFEKGYKENWSEEVYTVTQVILRDPPVYKIKDSQEEVIIGTFYAEELQKVGKPELFIIDQVLEERGRGRRKEYFVSWKGYPKEANQWIPASSIEEGVSL